MNAMDESARKGSAKNKQSLSIDLRVIVVLLLLIIGAMLFLWKPWGGDAANARTIEVRGEAKVTAQPDEFIFYPAYNFENADKNAALAELAKKSSEIVAKLRELGVAENKIKTTSSGGTNVAVPEPEKSARDTTYSLQLTITVNNTELAQKVQDYLASTAPVGSVSPQANFSDTKRKELEDKARVEALKDSKTKADQAAKELGFKVDKVKTVIDGAFAILSKESTRGVDVSNSSPKSSIDIHAGENELPYSITVTYFIY